MKPGVRPMWSLATALRRVATEAQVTDDEWAAIQEGNAQAERGEFVNDEDMAAFYKRHGV